MMASATDGLLYGLRPQGGVFARNDGPSRYPDGVKVLDRRGRTLGRVEGMVGPAAAPYLVVRTPDARDPKGSAAKLVGAEVYVEAAEVEAGAGPRARERKQGRPTGAPVAGRRH